MLSRLSPDGLSAMFLGAVALFSLGGYFVVSLSWAWQKGVVAVWWNEKRALVAFWCAIVWIYAIVALF